MRVNTPVTVAQKYTHEGAPAARINAEQALKRSVMACMLWEDTFYEEGTEIQERIGSLIKQVPAETVAAIALGARTAMKLRHVPLLLAVEMAKLPTHRHVVASTVASIIQRPDELAEILAIYSKGRTGTKTLNKLSKQLQTGIAVAFRKFNEYSLAKYNQDNAIKLRDVLFLTHPKPESLEQHQLWMRLVNGTLATPDTWEVALSAATDKKAAWTRLLTEEKLGAFALLRNLRNMKEAGVDENLIKNALLNMSTERVLPFRFIAAARYAPQWEQYLEAAMLRSLVDFPKLLGKTAIVVDNSGSMDSKVSGKSEITRQDAASALAILVREVCQDTVVIGFGDSAAVIPARRGFALRDAIQRGPGGGTNTQTALMLAQQQGYDRIIVITDEQSHQAIGAPARGAKGYFINVATNKNGIGYGPWTHIDGWSEAVLQYIVAAEADGR
jgi:60 kDa SS-A/Ro ribonucleoprotein